MGTAVIGTAAGALLDTLRRSALNCGHENRGGAMKSFSTAGLPPRRKVPYWNEISSETFAPLEVVPADRERFDARLCRETLGPLALADVCSAAGVVHHTEAHIARAADRGYTLITPINDGFRVAFESRPGFALRTGEFCLLDQCRPYSLTLPQFTRTFCVALDGPALRALIPNVQRVVGIPMRAENGTARMLALLLQQLSQELQEDRTRTLTPAFAQCLTGFVATAYSEAVEPEEISVLQSRKLRIRHYIEAQLHEPLLRPAAIARHFGISTRYLRLMFESEREPLSAYLLRRRLERCARLLRDPAWRGQTITDIALRNGFNNLTYFGSAFRKRFGVAPRDYRV
jgi:AraC family transcriptional activator of tynA and feaB